MESDWCVTAGADDPVIETPWSDAASGLAWMDLRIERELQRCRISTLSEAAASPAIAQALALLNAPGGLLMTAKCDRWPMSTAELQELADVLDRPPTAVGYGSYIDVLIAHAGPMSDFQLHEEWARMSARRCSALDVNNARAELIVRPAYKDGILGFGLSVYCYADDVDERSAEVAWAAALERIVPIVITAAEALFACADEISG